MVTEESRNVLDALQRNAKENIAVIAKECHMSKEKCSRMIRHLEKTGKIWGYSAVVDEHELPYKKFVLLLKRTTKKYDEATLDRIEMEQFKKEYEPLGVRIESSYYLHGEYDWLVIFTAADLVHAKKFSSILFDHYPGIAEKVNIMEILYVNRVHFIKNPDQSKLREYI